MIIVDKISPLRKQYFEVLLSSGLKIKMYSSDLRKYCICEGSELSEEKVSEIYHSCVTVRARKKVLEYLEKSEQSEAELRRKLGMKGFSEEAVEDAISYAFKYGFIDDSRYVRSYIRTYCRTKSVMQMEFDLRGKGISKELFQQVYNEELEDEMVDSEDEALLRALSKKTKDVSSLSYEEKQKIAASLYRKGFKQDSIRRVLEM